jgi:hypothetical protein
MKILAKVEYRNADCVGGDLTFEKQEASWEACVENGVCTVDIATNVPDSIRAGLEQALRSWACPDASKDPTKKVSGSKEFDIEKPPQRPKPV